MTILEGMTENFLWELKLVLCKLWFLVSLCFVVLQVRIRLYLVTLSMH